MPIAEGFVKLLFEKMSSKLPTFEGIIGSQLTNWTNMLPEIEAVLIDAGEKQLTDPAVSLWLDDLQDLAYDLDDVVDEFATEALCQKLMEDPTPQASSSKVGRCENLESIPEGWFHSATNLTVLNITGCKKLKALPVLPRGLQTIKYLTSLQELYLNISHWNNNFKKIGLRSLSSLKRLSIEGKEEEHPVGSTFPIDGMLLPTSLTLLGILNFQNLEKLSSKLFQNLASLEQLYIWDCSRLKSLPVQRLPLSLKELRIRGSPKLTGKCEKGKGKYWPHFGHIPQVHIC